MPPSSSFDREAIESDWRQGASQISSVVSVHSLVGSEKGRRPLNLKQESSPVYWFA